MHSLTGMVIPVPSRKFSCFGHYIPTPNSVNLPSSLRSDVNDVHQTFHAATNAL